MEKFKVLLKYEKEVKEMSLEQMIESRHSYEGQIEQLENKLSKLINLNQLLLIELFNTGTLERYQIEGILQESCVLSLELKNKI